MSTSNDWWNRVYQKVASNVFGNEDPRQQQQNPQFFDLLCHPFGCSRSSVSTSTATATVNQLVTSKPLQAEVPVPPHELLETAHQPWSLESIPVNQSLYPEFQKEFISLLSQGLAVHALIIPQKRQQPLQTKPKTLGITHHPHAPTKIGFLSKETKECNRLSRKYSMALTDVISLTSSPKVNKCLQLDWDKEDFRKRLIQVQSVSGISLLFAMPTVSEAQVVLCGLKTLLEQESVRWGRRGGARIDYSVHSKYFLDHNSVDDDDDTIPTTSTSHPSSNASSNNNSHSSNDNYDGGQLLLEDLVTNCNVPLPLPLCRALMLDSESPVMTAWSTDNLATSWTFPTNHHSPNNYGTTPPSTDAAVLVAFKNMVGATRNWMHKNNPSEKDTPTLRMIIDEDDDDKLACTISEHAPRNGFSIQIHILFRKMNSHCCEASIMAELRPIIPTDNKQTQYPSFLLQDLTKRYGTHDKGLLGTVIHVVDTFPVRSSTNHNYCKKNNEETSYQQETKAKTNRNNNNNVINMIPTKTTTVKKKNADNQLASSFNHQVLTVSKSFDYENESNQDFHNYDHDNNNNTLVTNTNHQKNGIPTDIKNNTTQNPYNIDNHSNFPRTKPGSPETKRKSLNDTKHQNYPERPATPSLRTKMDHEETRPSRRNQLQIRNDDAFQELQFNNNNNHFHPPGPKRTIAVKPLPKIRLDLMPAPREEDEDNCSSASLPETKAPKTTKKKKSYSMRKNDTKKKTDDKRKRRSKRHVP